VIDLHGKRNPSPERPHFGDGDVDIGLAAMCRLGDANAANALRECLRRELTAALNSVPVRNEENDQCLKQSSITFLMHVR
jgi:hypothetical protein